jgi:hypothetical protein
MPADDPPESGFSLKRWSRRKLSSARAASSPATVPPVPAATGTMPATSTPPAMPPDPGPGAATTVPGLPPVGDLTFDSDFTAFLQPRVDKALRQQALRKLFRDPRFNVMDGLDVYIDDYSLPDPVPPELVKEMVHARYVLDPPKTRIGADGTVEEVPPDAALAGPTPALEPDTGTVDHPLCPGDGGEAAGEGVDVPSSRIVASHDPR